MDDNDARTSPLLRRIKGIPAKRKALLVGCSCLLIIGLVLSFVSLHPAHADNSYTQGAASTSSSNAQIWFQPSGWTAGYVIVHYTVAGGTQQNVNMTYNSSSSRWEYTINSLTTGQVIAYSFTYQVNGLQYDSSSYSYTFGSSSSSTPTAVSTTGVTPTATSTGSGSGSSGDGTYPLVLQNNTGGKWSNDQIYITVLGQVTAGQWSYLKSDGSLSHINHLDATANGHLTKNGVNYANMSFTLAQASTVTMPATLQGARMYISEGSPMYFPIASDDSGWGGPDLNNASDPNSDVYFDWYEFTYQYGVTAFGGNTTQVDMFGFPMTARLQQSSSSYDQTVGITESRDQVYSQYTSSVGSVFQPLETTYRIVSPSDSSIFNTGGSQANYLQSYIDQTWNYYASNQFTFGDFSGKVVNGQLQFTDNGSGSYAIGEPTTHDVFSCSGTLATGSSVEKALEADLCAAFNRGVAMNTADWNNVSSYYSNSLENDYAKVWHQVSLNGKAYGFPYDDVNSQSSVTILPNANAPTSLTIGVGW